MEENGKHGIYIREETIKKAKHILSNIGL